MSIRIISERRKSHQVRQGHPHVGVLRAAVVIGLLMLPAGVRGAEPTTKKPNILILLVDQLRWSEVGCYGNEVVKTPHIDRLAGEGVRFTHAYSNFPSCSPARSILLTGCYARSNGYYANAHGMAPPGERPDMRERTLAETLSAAGYVTALIGKWHLTPQPQTVGFQKSWRVEYGEGYMKTGWRVDEKPESDYTYEGYTLEHEAELAVRFLREHRDKPFFLYATTSPPHMPLEDLPERYKAMYKPEDMPLRPNVYKDGKLAYDENWFKIYMWDYRYYKDRNAFNRELPKDMDLRDLLTLYYGQTTAADDWAGRILKELKDLGLEDNTIVIFSSDHGDLFGSHQLFNKNELYDEASRIPLIFRYPPRLKPRVIERQIVSLVDMMPTLLDMCALPIPPSVQGTSFAAVLTGQKETVGENVAYIETTGKEGIRTMDHVFWCNRKTQQGESLFDLVKDPYAMDNVVGKPAYGEVRKKLRAMTTAWRERTPSAEPAEAPAQPRVGRREALRRQRETQATRTAAQ